MTTRITKTFFALVLVSSACSRTTVSVPRLRPAEVNLAAYKRLAIGGIGGHGGDVLVADLTQALMETQRFDVLDRQHLKEVIKEQDFAVSGRVSDDSAVSIGQMIGSSALLVGDISHYKYDEQVAKKNTTCTITEKQGKKNVTKSIPCTKYSRNAAANLSVAFKLIDTESGKILAAKSHTASRNKASGDQDSEPPPFLAQDPLLAECRHQVVSEFVKVIAPYKENISVELLDDGDAPELEQGNNYAKLGNWRQAMALYGTALERKELKPAVRAKGLYNLGVALGYSGDYDAGIGRLEESYSLETDERTRAQIATIRAFKEDDAKLAEQQKAPDSQ